MGGGFTDFSCLENNLEFGMDVVPVLISNIQVLEFDGSQQVISQQSASGSFFSGSTFNFISVADNPESITSFADIPRGIQMNLNGINAIDEDVVSSWIFLYSNSCSFFPIFEEGQRAGWAIFVSIFLQANLLCLCICGVY